MVNVQGHPLICSVIFCEPYVLTGTASFHLLGWQKITEQSDKNKMATLAIIFIIDFAYFAFAGKILCIFFSGWENFHGWQHRNRYLNFLEKNYSFL